MRIVVIVFLGLCLMEVTGEYTFSKVSWEQDSTEDGGPPGKKPTTCPCGWANKLAQRIVKGKDAERNEFPFIVAVMDKTPKGIKRMCGGTILTPHFVITAAHCTRKNLQDPEGHEIVVAAGVHNLKEETQDSPANIYTVDRVIRHPSWEFGEMTFDIALLLLGRCIEFNQYIGPVCLSPVQKNLEKKYVKIIGWGKTSHDGLGSAVLQKVNLRVIPLKACADVHSKVNVSARNQLCTFSNNGRSACQGDSGGPVLWVDPDTNRYDLVGLVSYGKICGTIYPTVHTDVSAYFNWIQTTIRVTNSLEDVCRNVEAN